MASSGKYTWRITDYSGRKSERSIIYSDVFTLGGCNWRIRVDHPNGLSNVGWLSVYLAVADNVDLPIGWCIHAKYCLTLVNQLQSHKSTTFEENNREFKKPGSICGWTSFKTMSEIHDSSKGYLVNDSIVVEAGVEVLNVSPPTLLLETSLSNLGKFIADHAGQGQNIPKSEFPSLKEVEIAKQSLKECLTEFEQHKLARDQMLRSLTKYHETFLSNKQQLDDLTKEEEEYRKRMEEAKSKKSKLISHWQNLIIESEETKSEYMVQEKKVEEALQRKKIAEERLSHYCTTAWSSLKQHFAN